MSAKDDKVERAWLEQAWAKSGKRLNMGGCCVRFRGVDDAALDVIGETIRRTRKEGHEEARHEAGPALTRVERPGPTIPP